MATIVLIHGAYQGGWIWRDVARHLRAAGHTVFTPSLDGCAERCAALRPGITTEIHGEEIAGLLFFQDLHDVILVGTSSGGMVLCHAAELAPQRIARLVFVDALALFDGERLSDIVRRPAATTTDTELATEPSRADAESRMFAGLDATTRTWALERITPHPIAAMQDPVRLERFWTMRWDASVVWCRRSANPPAAHQRWTAERLDATWRELDTGHYPMLTEPEALARLIA